MLANVYPLSHDERLNAVKPKFKKYLDYKFEANDDVAQDPFMLRMLLLDG